MKQGSKLCKDNECSIHLPAGHALLLAYLDFAGVNLLGQIIDIHVAIQCKRGSTLDQTLNLSSTEVLGPLCIHLLFIASGSTIVITSQQNQYGQALAAKGSQQVSNV